MNNYIVATLKQLLPGEEIEVTEFDDRAATSVNLSYLTLMIRPYDGPEADAPAYVVDIFDNRDPACGACVNSAEFDDCYAAIGYVVATYLREA